MAGIRTERLQLCRLGPSAADQVRDYYQRNQIFFRPWLPRYGPNFFSEGFHSTVLRHEQQLFKKSHQLRFFLFKLEDTRLTQIMGDLRFARTPHEDWYTASLGYKLDENQQGQGFMEEALSASIPLIFQFWNIRKLKAYIPLENISSLSLIQRLGFELHYKEKVYLELNDKQLLHHCYELSKQRMLALYG